MEGFVFRDRPYRLPALSAAVLVVLGLSLCGCGQQAESVAEAAPAVDPALYAHLPPGQREAVAYLLERGARINANGDHVTDVNLLSTDVSDDDLAQLVHLPALEKLSLISTPITDAGLRHVGRLETLRELLLSRTRITDAGLAHLKSLPQLKMLILARTGITDAGLTHLKALSSLEQLSLSHTAVTDAGLAHLSELVHVSNLHTGGTEVTFAGEMHLFYELQERSAADTLRVVAHARLDDDGRLVQLELTDDRIRDDDLRCLEELHSLEVLALAGHGMTDDALQHLCGLHSLRSLLVRAPGITEKGLAELQRALPECEVLR